MRKLLDDTKLIAVGCRVLGNVLWEGKEER